MNLIYTNKPVSLCLGSKRYQVGSQVVEGSQVVVSLTYLVTHVTRESAQYQEIDKPCNLVHSAKM